MTNTQWCVSARGGLDETRRSFTLKLDGISVPQSQLLDGDDFAALEQAAMLMLVAEMSGGSTGAAMDG